MSDKPRTVFKDAASGRFVSAEEAAARPATTMEVTLSPELNHMLDVVQRARAFARSVVTDTPVSSGLHASAIKLVAQVDAVCRAYGVEV